MLRARRSCWLTTLSIPPDRWLPPSRPSKMRALVTLPSPAYILFYPSLPGSGCKASRIARSKKVGASASLAPRQFITPRHPIGTLSFKSRNWCPPYLKRLICAAASPGCKIIATDKLLTSQKDRLLLPVQFKPIAADRMSVMILDRCGDPSPSRGATHEP